MGIFDVVSTVVGVGLDLYGKKKKSDDREEAAEDNAAAMQKEAEYQQWRTSILLKRHTDYTNKLIAAQRVAYAKNGIQIDIGTANRLAEQTAIEAAEDAALIKQEGQFNYERALLGAKSFSNQADSYRTSGYIETASSLLVGGMDIAKQFDWI